MSNGSIRTSTQITTGVRPRPGLTMRAMLSASVLTVASAGALTVASAGAASAACTDYFLCVWKGANRTDSAFYSSISNSNWDYLGNPAAIRNMNDEDSSAQNNTERTYARVWQDDNYTASSYCVRPGEYKYYVGDSHNDRGSSHRFYSSC
jgi:hypothetical protein